MCTVSISAWPFKHCRRVITLRQVVLLTGGNAVVHEVVARSFWEVLHWDEIKVATIRAAAQFWDVWEFCVWYFCGFHHLSSAQCVTFGLEWHNMFNERWLWIPPPGLERIFARDGMLQHCRTSVSKKNHLGVLNTDMTSLDLELSNTNLWIDSLTFMIILNCAIPHIISRMHGIQIYICYLHLPDIYQGKEDILAMGTGLESWGRCVPPHPQVQTGAMWSWRIPEISSAMLMNMDSIDINDLRQRMVLSRWFFALTFAIRYNQSQYVYRSNLLCRDLYVFHRLRDDVGPWSRWSRFQAEDPHVRTPPTSIVDG